MSELSLQRIPKADLIRLLTESRAREAAATEKLKKLEEDFCRKTSDLEIAQSRIRGLEMSQAGIVRDRTSALGDLEGLRQNNRLLAGQIDGERALRVAAEENLADLRSMAQVVKLVAGRE